jgi:hypothetical protein
MPQSKEKPAEQCLICFVDKKKPKSGFLFWFGVVKFLVNFFTLIDKYMPKILSYFDNDLQ